MWHLLARLRRNKLEIIIISKWEWKHLRAYTQHAWHIFHLDICVSVCVLLLVVNLSLMHFIPRAACIYPSLFRSSCAIHAFPSFAFVCYHRVHVQVSKFVFFAFSPFFFIVWIFIYVCVCVFAVLCAFIGVIQIGVFARNITFFPYLLDSILQFGAAAVNSMEGFLRWIITSQGKLNARHGKTYTSDSFVNLLIFANWQKLIVAQPVRVMLLYTLCIHPLMRMMAFRLRPTFFLSFHPPFRSKCAHTMCC